MVVTFEDQVYNFDIEALDFNQAKYIKRNFQLTLKGLIDGLDEMDGDALGALYWLMLAQNNKTQDAGKMNFPIFKFAEALGAALAAEAEEEKAQGKAPAQRARK